MTYPERFTIRITTEQNKAYKANQVEVFAKIRELLDSLAKEGNGENK
jgi:hypothetical protein